MPRDGEVIFNEPAYRREFQSWEGDVGQWMTRKTLELEDLARASAGFDTGRLVAEIRTARDHTLGGDLEARVGANPDIDTGVGYAYWNHEGTDPHEIRPRRPGGVLKFRSRGMVVYATRVNHPGTEATKFLTRWLSGLF